MTTTKILVESWKPKKKKMVKRDDIAYQQCLEETTQALERLLEEYRTTVFEEDMRARLKRDAMDHWIRRYHKYAIQGKIKSHYKQRGVSMAPEDCIFEHVIPEGQARDMLIDGALTIVQALNIPTCRISRVHNKMLNDRGMHDHNTEPYYPFKRYVQGMQDAIEIETYNGQVISNLNTWTLDDHFKQFNIG